MMVATLEILNPADESYGRFSTGILPSHVLTRLFEQGREITAAEPFAKGQIQPASLDLRLGPVAYRVRASADFAFAALAGGDNSIQAGA